MCCPLLHPGGPLRDREIDRPVISLLTRRGICKLLDSCFLLVRILCRVRGFSLGSTSAAREVKPKQESSHIWNIWDTIIRPFRRSHTSSCQYESGIQLTLDHIPTLSKLLPNGNTKRWTIGKHQHIAVGAPRRCRPRLQHSVRALPFPHLNAGTPRPPTRAIRPLLRIRAPHYGTHKSLPSRIPNLPTRSLDSQDAFLLFRLPFVVYIVFVVGFT